MTAELRVWVLIIVTLLIVLVAVAWHSLRLIRQFFRGTMDVLKGTRELQMQVQHNVPVQTAAAVEATRTLTEVKEAASQLTAVAATIPTPDSSLRLSPTRPPSDPPPGEA